MFYWIMEEDKLLFFFLFSKTKINIDRCMLPYVKFYFQMSK